MAFTKTLAQRLFGVSRIANPAVANSRSSAALKSAAATPSTLAPDPGDSGIWRRYIHRGSAPPQSVFRFIPTGEKLMEKLRAMDIARDRIRLDGLIPPPTVADARKILRLSQLEAVKSKLRQIEKDCISYKEFSEICAKECSSLDQGMEFAKMLDESGSVIVLGNIVFLKPEQEIETMFRKTSW